ncbi:unnamed protein product [Staurois parvus]|uniref:Uncharacterized protein n=1 Tax=Staurois parvus TaxID=386267 RepID=A0ABN9HNH1_9NEOB|nr:unnamed protein product [Staurois parvus]
MFSSSLYYILYTVIYNGLDMQHGMVGTPHNEHSRCTDPGTQHKDGGNPS